MKKLVVVTLLLVLTAGAARIVHAAPYLKQQNTPTKEEIAINEQETELAKEEQTTNEVENNTITNDSLDIVNATEETGKVLSGMPSLRESITSAISPSLMIADTFDVSKESCADKAPVNDNQNCNVTTIVNSQNCNTPISNSQNCDKPLADNQDCNVTTADNQNCDNNTANNDSANCGNVLGQNNNQSCNNDVNNIINDIIANNGCANQNGNVIVVKPGNCNTSVSIPTTTPTPDTEVEPEITPEVEPETTPEITENFLAAVEQEIFKMVNEERIKAGVPALTYNNTMQKYARIKSKDMGDNSYFSHEDLNGNLITVQMQKDGVRYNAWGENIAWLSNRSSLAAQFMDMWMNSEGHRKNILSTNFESIGIGVYQIGNKIYATQEFYR